MKNPFVLFMAAAICLLSSIASANERTLTTFDGNDSLRWQTVNDGVMGGLSRGDSQITRSGTLLFAGEISLENNGGFSSIRTLSQDLELGGYDGLEIRVRGDGRTYKMSLRTKDTSSWIAYWADFETEQGEWTTVRIPFSKWAPTTFGRKLEGPRLSPSSINSVGFMLYDKKAGPFALEVASIAAFKGASVPKDAGNDGTPTILETAQQDARTKAIGLIQRAVDVGVPLYNNGKPEACCVVYELAATALLGLEGNLFSPRVRDQLRSALDSSEPSEDRAWTLRRALDAAYGQLQEDLNK